jgi:hypothetical protein
MPHCAGASRPITSSAVQAYNAGIDQSVQRTVWAAGCTSWYQTADGRNPINWPGFTFRYRWLTRRANLSHYKVLP